MRARLPSALREWKDELVGDRIVRFVSGDEVVGNCISSTAFFDLAIIFRGGGEVGLLELLILFLSLFGW